MHAKTCWNLPDPKYSECLPNSDPNFRKTREARKQIREGRFCHSSGKYIGGRAADHTRQTNRLILEPVPKAAASLEATALHVRLLCKEPRCLVAAEVTAQGASALGTTADVLEFGNECLPPGSHCQSALRDVGWGVGFDGTQAALGRAARSGRVRDVSRAMVATASVVYEFTLGEKR